jgi:hypothetical protein
MLTGYMATGFGVCEGTVVLLLSILQFPLPSNVFAAGSGVQEAVSSAILTMTKVAGKEAERRAKPVLGTVPMVVNMLRLCPRRSQRLFSPLAISPDWPNTNSARRAVLVAENCSNVLVSPWGRYGSGTRVVARSRSKHSVNYRIRAKRYNFTYFGLLQNPSTCGSVAVVPIRPTAYNGLSGSRTIGSRR